jgi:lysophospholipase L1-like esterase
VNTRGRLISGLVTTVVALAGFVTAGALPAAAAPSTVDYVALGDSYAAGTAAPGSFPDCPHGAGGYPALLADGSESRISLTTNAACSGATISEVASKQLSALERHTRLVTLTVGAANLGLSVVLAACSNPNTPVECQRQINRALALLRDCPEDKNSLVLDCSLAPLYAQVAREARGARIVVTGYPLLFDSPASGDPRAAINQATTRLNSLIERAVTATQATYANITYVDVTKEFAGHGIGCTTPCTLFINAAGQEAFHPTPAGYQAYADAISAVLPAGWLDKP